MLVLSNSQGLIFATVMQVLGRTGSAAVDTKFGGVLKEANDFHDTEVLL